jgi:protein DGCR14
MHTYWLLSVQQPCCKTQAAVPYADGQCSHALCPPDLLLLLLLFCPVLFFLLFLLLQAKQVLVEDVYAEAIEAIVERDFFPHLPKLQNQLEWLQAVQSGDPALIKRAQLNIARRRAGLRTPVVHDGAIGAPSTAAITPGTGLLRTPAMTPAVGLGGATPAAGRTPAGAAAAAALQEQGMDPVSAQQQVGARAPGMGLDQFFSSYEGEDNASFQVLHEQTLARKRAKVTHHLEDKNKPLLLEAGGHSTDEYGSSGQAPSTVLSTRHVPQNALYYDSSQQPQLALTAAEKATIVAGPAKVINHSATRSLHEDADDPGEAGSSQRGKATAAPAPGTQGYGYMRTPQIVPGVNESPLMTWGDIASTPLRLDSAGQPDLQGLEMDLGLDDMYDPEAAAAAMGKQFTLPEVRSRETAAQQLMAKKAASFRKKQAPLQRSNTPLLNSLRRTTGLGTPARGSTPGSGTPGLSAAGLKLAQQLKRPGTGQRGGSSSGVTSAALQGGDLQLRASYQRAGSTPSRPATGQVQPSGQWEPTPGRSSGGATSGSVVQQHGITRQQQSAKHAPVGKVAAKQPSAAASAGGNITDDLLQL